MSCLSSTRRAELIAQLNKKLAQLENLNAAYDDMIESGSIKSYRFDSGEGSQRVEYRSLDDVQKSISHLEAQIERLRTKLRGGGLSNLNLRRKQYFQPGISSRLV